MDDIISDFSVFHRITEAQMWSMASAVFAKLAERLPAYGGAVRASLIAAQAQQEDGSEPPGVAPFGTAPPDAGESFESRMARAKPIMANAAGEAQISRLMTAGA